MKCPTCKNPVSIKSSSCEWCDSPLALSQQLDNEDMYIIELIKTRGALEAVKYHHTKHCTGLKYSKKKIDELLVILKTENNNKIN